MKEYDDEPHLPGEFVATLEMEREQDSWEFEISCISPMLWQYLLRYRHANLPNNQDYFIHNTQ